ncbi:MAG: hypothetical protein A3G25_19255 [Betaproteobacteria bacterium RIFCSPLOWO2_12_FULL_63_13]|nr:MAG: hypothetical protein A3G25_19255 [Betaproteobacteria bacterium RIFCSPLOWO2_12_FULL_63_13]
MGDTLPTIRVAAVQAAPVLLDREATTEKACRLIREAGAEGARIIGFPEGFIPCHPLWYHFHPASSGRSRQLASRLFLNSVEIPSATTDLLCEAARDTRAYVVMGLCERLAGTTGTMYNSQLFIGPDGQIIGRRRKIMPTLGERIVHALGSGEGLRPVETEFGPLSGLMCGENSNPLATFTLMAMGTRIHVASWPSHFTENESMIETIQMSTRALAYQGAMFVINSVGLVSDDMIDVLAVTDADRLFLTRRQQEPGGASVISPRGQIIAGPMAPGEGLLYADIDLAQIVTRKTVQDFAGHYNRPDLFKLMLDVRQQAQFRPAEASPNEIANAGPLELQPPAPVAKRLNSPSE